MARDRLNKIRNEQLFEQLVSHPFSRGAVPGQNSNRSQITVVDFVAAAASEKHKVQRTPGGWLQCLQPKAHKIREIHQTSIRPCLCLRARGSGVRISPGAPYFSKSCGRSTAWCL